MILTKSLSRFARNTVDCLEVVRMLRANGIGVIFEKEYIRNGGKPCISRISAVFLCLFVAYLSLKSTKQYRKILEDISNYAANHWVTQF